MLIWSLDGLELKLATNLLAIKPKNFIILLERTGKNLGIAHHLTRKLLRLFYATHKIELNEHIV